MIWQVYQHIYSGSRPSFETVAVSPELPAPVVTALEARAQRYPDRARWRSDVPPLVVRGFPVQEAGEGVYAVSFLTYAGQCWDGSPGNYLAHSFVIPAGMLAEQGFNLAWIAASLTPVRHYEPVCASGADWLPPLSVELDPGHQFLLFAFVARELEQDAVAGLMLRVVEHLSGAGREALALALPPPHPELARVFGEVFGPCRDLNSDLLRLYRLAGALSVLPPAFLRGGGFSVNDEPAGKAFEICVPRAEEAAPNPPAEWPWLDHLTTLARENRRDEFLGLCGWLRQLTPAGYKPSRRAVDEGFLFHHAVIAAPQANLDAVVVRLRAMAGCQVSVGVLHNGLNSVLETAGVAQRREIYIELSRLGASRARPLIPAVLAGIIECLDPRSDDGRVSFLRELPDAVQAQVWLASFERRVAPGYLPGQDSAGALALFLATFRPDIFADYAAREALLRHAIDAMAAQGEGLVPGRINARLHRIRTAVATLTRAKNCSEKLRVCLAEQIADEFTRCYPFSVGVATTFGSFGFERTSELRDAIRDPLYSSATDGPYALAEFSYRISDGDPLALMLLLFDLDLANAKSRLFLGHVQFMMDQLCHRLAPNSGDDLGMTLRVALELAELVAAPNLLNGSDSDERRVDSCRAWLKHLRERAVPPGLYRKFLHRLADTVDGLPSQQHLAVAALYLAAGVEEDVGIFERALWQVSQSAAMARWLDSGPRNAKSGPVRHLARLLLAADRRGPAAVEGSAETIYRVVVWLPAGDRKDWLRLVEIALNREDADGSVWRRVEKTILKILKVGGSNER
jgi:hypothetical protein